MKIFILILFFSSISFGRTSVIQKYDHQMHEEKVFSKLKVKCADCHQVKEDNQGSLKLESALQQATFKKSLKNICHDCHQNQEVIKSSGAPGECYTCHQSQDMMMAIKPQSHQNQSWKTQHAFQARTDSSQCLNCHSQSQCVKCHSTRNPVMNVNHSRNYKFFHSIEARMSPQKCDTCHTKSYCTRCHIGGVK